MNQTSFSSLVVPVLPAIGLPTSLTALPVRRWTKELAFVVFRPPHAAAGIYLKRRIEYDRRRRIAIVERRRIDQRFKRRPGLALGLRCTVELALVIGEPPDHGQHAACHGVH